MHRISKAAVAVCMAAIIMTAALFSSFAAASGAAEFIITDITADGEEFLMGTDHQTPAFSWKMVSDRTGAKQTAYRIVVQKAVDETTVWDSGRVEASNSVGIVYAGDKLEETTEYTYTIHVWDEKNAEAVSEPHYFETAYFADAFSDAEWIKLPEESDAALHYTVEADLTLLSDAAAIVFSARDTSNMFAWQFNTYNYGGRLYLRPHIWENGGIRVEDIELENKVPAADFLGKEKHISLDVYADRVDTYIDGALVNTYAVSGVSDGMVGIRVSSDGKNHEHALLDNVKVTTYSGGKTDERFYDFEQTNLFSGGTVTAGKLDCDGGTGTSTYVYFEPNEGGTPVFRKSILLAKPKSARLYSTALGVYDVFINGERVGTDGDAGKVYDELKPGWSNYNKRVLYHTYDVTDYIVSGTNVITGIVTGGWWNGEIAHGTYGSKDCAFMAKLVLTYANGSRYVVATDESWSASTEGAVRYADIYGGETYDARYGNDYMLAGYDDSEWDKAAVSNDFQGTLSAFNGSNIRVDEALTRQAERITLYSGAEDNGSDYGRIHVLERYDSLSDGVTVEKGQTLLLDMGQNMVGWPQLSLRAESGTHVRVNFAEMLNDSGQKSRGNDGPEGSIYTANYRTAKSLLTYISAGGGEIETYSPTMTYFGFRYLELTADDTVTVYRISGKVVTCDAEQTGFIETSNADVNQLFSNILWGQRGNYLSAPTDCPQRDERLGWSGDTQIFVGTAVYNADVSNFYRKWADDAVDSQWENGAYPDVIPVSNLVGGGAGAWSDVGIIAPWTVYEAYGDIGILENNYASMEKYMDWLDNGTYDGPYTTYGDWLAYEGTDARLISVAYYAYDAALMAKIAAALGKTEDVQKYRRLFQNIKASFIERYVNADGSMKQTSQTAYLLALKFNLLPDDASRTLISDRLIEKLRQNNNQLSTGFVGTGIIAQTLSEIGRSNQAYSLLLTDDDPSWLYSVHQGATTVWERWNSYTIANGFGDVSMNSFNHYAYGAVAEWMYESMAGIRADEENPGFSHFLLEPQIDTRTGSELPSGQENITYVKGAYQSRYGLIRSEWSTEAHPLDYTAQIPANSTATLTLPVMEGAKYVTVNGKTYALFTPVTAVTRDPFTEIPHISDIAVEGVEYVSLADGRIALKLDSGSYDVSMTQEIPETQIVGDVDADGYVTVSDVVALRQLILSGTWTDKQLGAGDLDKNDALTVSDVVMLRRQIVQG